MKRDSGLQSRVVAAVKNIERDSSIEVVVSLSPRTIRPTIPILASALAVCVVSLTIYPVLFTEAEPVTITADSFFVSVVVALLAATLPPLQRVFFSKQHMHAAALAAARAEFVHKGIHNTLRRTGLLLYISVFEHQALLVADIGVKAMIPAEEMARLEEAAEIFKSSDPDAQLTAFFELLRQTAARYMPRHGDDINELPDNFQTN